MDQSEARELKTSGGIFGFGPLLIPAQQAFASIGVGNTKGYELIAAGLLVARKIGTRTMIEAESLRAYVAGLPKLPTRTT